MKIIADILTLKELKQIATAGFGDMVKAVVDISTGLLAVDSEEVRKKIAEIVAKRIPA